MATDPAPVEDTLPVGPLVDLVRFRFDRAEWVHDAACRDTPTDVFYIERGESNLQALAICADCPVRIRCREYALDHNEKYGVWGGTSERERRLIKRRGRRSTA